MAELFVRHILNAAKVAKFNLNLRSYVLYGNEGEELWLLEVGTTTLDINGEAIVPKFINNVSETTIEDEIETAIADLCSQIDWTTFDIDRYPPILTEFSPVGKNVPIKSIVRFYIEDELPSSGIDFSEFGVFLNNGEVDFDITSEVTVKGDPYRYEFTWVPPNING